MNLWIQESAIEEMRFTVTLGGWKGITDLISGWKKIPDCRGCSTGTSGTEGQIVKRKEKKVGVVGVMIAERELRNSGVDYNV